MFIIKLNTVSIAKNKKIVVIGGGTGVFTVLSGLRRYFNDLSAIVTMADDGGSTGILREEFGILPPGDVRRSLVALARTDNEILAKLFNYRFQEGYGLTGHSFGNLMLAALERITGDFESAIKEAGKILSVQGRVLPVTLKKSRLCAELENGETIRGETNIDIPKHDGNLRIKRVWLKPPATVNPKALKAVLSADAVLIGPGGLHYSIIPNLLVGGVKEALKKSKAKKIFFVNLVTKWGDTSYFQASDFLNTIESYLLPGTIDFTVINTGRPKPKRFRPYIQERSELVEFDKENFKDRKKPTILTGDFIRQRGLIRHDSEKIARLIRMIV